MPQELATDTFETPWATVNLSRGLFGCPPDPAYVEKVLRDLSLWDKRKERIMTLSGGMKRRVMIAKALSHEPEVLFLDEPTAGVDVELRRDMWALVRGLRDRGVTIILTTHYIEEAEEMADRIGVISKGELILVEDKVTLMKKLGKKQLTLQLQEPMSADSGGPGRLASDAEGQRLRAGIQLRCRRGPYRYSCAAAAHGRARHRLQGSQYAAEFAGGHLRQPGQRARRSTGMSGARTVTGFNRRGVWAIYRFELARFRRTLLQSLVAPVMSTSLYFVVFGSAIGSRMSQVNGVPYAAFIVPGLIMLSIFTESLSNASFGIYFPKFTGTIYEILSAPVSPLEIVLAYVGAAATKSVLLGLLILVTASLFVPLHILHPLWMVAFLLLTAATFSLFGFIIGIWAKGFDQLQFVPMLIVTPLTFLGGAFYSIDMLPQAWRTITLFNPVVYLISGFRWAFYGTSDVGVGISLAMTLGFFALCLGLVTWIFKTGYRLKN